MPSDCNSDGICGSGEDCSTISTNRRLVDEYMLPDVGLSINDQLPKAAHAHAVDALVPSRDDLPGAERESKARTGVELRPLVLCCIGVIEPARIIDDGSGPIPPNATLVFDIQLVSLS